eukprot:1023461-Pyramimonas_sp.AAC.1
MTQPHGLNDHLFLMGCAREAERMPFKGGQLGYAQENVRARVIAKCALPNTPSPESEATDSQ